VTFTTQPANLPLQIEGLSVSTPRTVISWPGYKVNVAAPVYMTPGGPRELARWSDGETQAARTITTPSRASIYTAIYHTGRSGMNAVYLPVVIGSGPP
jgi:hypothetical protein